MGSVAFFWFLIWFQVFLFNWIFVLIKSQGRLIGLELLELWHLIYLRLLTGWHVGLLLKLKSYGISGEVFDLMLSFLHNKQLQVNSFSFDTYINDLPDDVVQCRAQSSFGHEGTSYVHLLCTVKACEGILRILAPPSPMTPTSENCEYFLLCKRRVYWGGIFPGRGNEQTSSWWGEGAPEKVGFPGQILIKLR